MSTYAVYPRTGGGNEFETRTGAAQDGLSPHGRGKPNRALAVSLSDRSIPARAGETPSAVASLSQ